MVKQYTRTDPENDLQIVKDGSFCAYSDYLILAAALKEALDGWSEWYEESMGIDNPRIAELRKLIQDLVAITETDKYECQS